jgi:hypothetical protein
MPSLIDRVMPAWDFREYHRRALRASAELACDTLPRVNLAHSPLIGPLFTLRSVPGRLRRGGRALEAGRLGDFMASGFTMLVDERPRGFVLGTIGEFWRASGAIRSFEPAAFASNREPGCARLAWSFEFLPDAGGSLATTETRIRCNDRAAFRRMLAYWILIRPASGLIRREMLRLLARDCGAARHAPAT